MLRFQCSRDVEIRNCVFDCDINTQNRGCMDLYAGLMGLPIPAAITKAIDILKQRAETPEKGKD